MTEDQAPPPKKKANKQKTKDKSQSTCEVQWKPERSQYIPTGISVLNPRVIWMAAVQTQECNKGNWFILKTVKIVRVINQLF